MNVNTKVAITEYRQAQWARTIQDKNSSGLSVRAYCESVGMHENTYYYRLKKLRETACEELSTIQSRQSLTQPVFAEVKIPERPALSYDANSVNQDAWYLLIINTHKNAVIDYFH